MQRKASKLERAMDQARNAKAGMTDALQKIKPQDADGNVMRHEQSLIDLYCHDPEAVEGGLVRLVNQLHEAGGRELDGLRRTARAHKRSRRPGARKARDRKRTASESAAPPERDERSSNEAAVVNDAQEADQ